LDAHNALWMFWSCYTILTGAWSNGGWTVLCGDSFRHGGGMELFFGGVSMTNHPYDAVLVRLDTGQLCVILVGKIG